MKQSDIKTWTPGTILCVALMLLGGAAGLYRLVAGLGATTNLSDAFPWGMWLGVDMFAGVAMAAGGFIIAAMVYVFHLEKYRPIVRPAILTAFIGYLLAIVALVLDIGQPQRIWHPAVMWQVHSVMWVVAIHVILYTTTLALEFSPMFFERVGMPGVSRMVHRIIVPVVIFGALLSVLHQSSLGGIFLISEGKMSPLWYSPEIPKLFLVSAVMMGLSMVSFETIISSRAFKHEVDPGIFSGLARITLWVTGFYLHLQALCPRGRTGHRRRIRRQHGSKHVPARNGYRGGLALRDASWQGGSGKDRHAAHRGHPGDRRSTAEPAQCQHLQPLPGSSLAGNTVFPLARGVRSLRRD